MIIATSATSTIYLHVKQTEGTEIANVSFDLGAATMEYGNNAPYFQWGRKDPLPPSTGMANANKAIYGTYTTILDLNTTEIAATIRTPYYFNNNNGNPSLELWNVGNTNTTVSVDPVVKSIYDPSPIGFHIPCSGAFQGWDENGRFYWQNISGKWGRYFYQLGPTTGVPVFFPGLAWRGSGMSINETGHGFYWGAEPSSTYTAYYLVSTYNEVRTAHSDNRVYGLSVRPVME